MRYLYHMAPQPYSSNISKNVGYSLHQHKFVEILYVLSGSYSYTTKVKEDILLPGSLTIIFPYEMHAVASNDNENCRILTLLFDIDFVFDFKKRFCEYLMPQNVLHKKELEKSTLTALDWIIKSIQSDYSNDRLLIQKIQGWMTVVLGDIFYKRDLEKRKEKLNSELIEQLFHYIDKHIDKDFSIEEIARALGISQTYLTHTLKHVLSTSYNALLTTIRLEHAEILLRSPDRSLLEIALESGFQNTQAFTRNYKKMTGITPSEFRKQLQATEPKM